MMLMALNKEKSIFHLDCNSAFLSWPAVNMLSQVRKSNYINIKGIGNSTTSSFDIEDLETARLVIMSLCQLPPLFKWELGRCYSYSFVVTYLRSHHNLTLQLFATLGG